MVLMIVGAIKFPPPRMVFPSHTMWCPDASEIVTRLSGAGNHFLLTKADMVIGNH
jgi:hypothetical protein